VTYSEGQDEPVHATARLIGDDVWMASPQYDALPSGDRWIHSTLEGRISPCIAPDGTPKLLVIQQTEAEGGVRVEVELVDFGVEVDVEPPEAGRVVEASKLPG